MKAPLEREDILKRPKRLDGLPEQSRAMLGSRTGGVALHEDTVRELVAFFEARLLTVGADELNPAEAFTLRILCAHRHVLGEFVEDFEATVIGRLLGAAEEG